MATKYLASSDCGPTEVLLNKLPQHYSSLQQLLPFASREKYKALELSELIADFSKIRESLRRNLIRDAVVSWIFYTNHLEKAGVASLGETEEALAAGDPKTNREKETWSTYQLLRQNYQGYPSTAFQNCSFDRDKLLAWHTILFQDTNSDIAGKLRRSGTKTHNLDHSDHLFPHHTVIKYNLQELIGNAIFLSKKIDEIIFEQEKLLYTFTLAAFIQFHFLDLHPFTDGNGRMCRYLSKRILDSVCPAPFPIPQVFGTRQKGVESASCAKTPL